MQQAGEQKVIVNVRRRPAADPSFSKNPAGYDLTDGVFYKAKGQRRVLGRIRRQSSSSYEAWASVDGGFMKVGIAETALDANALIIKKNPLFDIGKMEKSARRRRKI